MDEYPDPGDFLEADDYDIYENRYEDELEMMMEEENSKPKNNNNNTKKANIDFTVESKKSQAELDKGLVTNLLNTKSGTKRSSSQLALHSDEELLYSDDEEEEQKAVEITQPKKLKIDDAKKNLRGEFSDLKNQLMNNIVDDEDFNEVAYDISRRRVFRRPIIGQDTLNITSTEGDRVFLKLNADTENEKSNLSYRNTKEKNGLNLLSIPFEELMAEVAAKRHSQAIQRTSAVQRIPDLQETKAMELWVDKYSPNKYTELLSDDGTNRLLLKWLKLWDNIVFHDGRNVNQKELKKRATKETESRKKESRFKRKDFKQTYANRQQILEEDLIHDKKGRPKQKVALLCGNPGLGKTTLAHVISKHAGYNVIEMNASDDRSPELFRNKIETSIQMKASVTGSKKPNCLVIDEIDGAPIQAINIIIDLVKATENSGKKAGNKKKGKKRDFTLNRPIICICNDPYVPALRTLRQVAFTLNFPPTLQSRLANRLLSISQLEQLRVDMGTLLLLAEKAENDIRSCLNTLQFIQQRMRDFKPEDVKTLEVGQKDMKKGIRTILSEVFQLPRVTRKKLIGNVNNMGANVKTGASARFHYMLHVVSGNTEFEKMMQGLFDQYLHCKTKEPYLDSINTGVEWLCFTDLIQQQIQHSQDFVLRRYSVFLPVAFHMYFARASAVKIQYSNVAYENHLKLATNQQTFQLMLKGMSPAVRRHCVKNPTLLDLVPYLFLMTSPNLRPVNTKLYSESEKQMFCSLVETMISYNLTYRQERNPEGHYTYLLEPNIEELITYTGLPQHKHLPYATKQLVAREIDLEKMRKAERMMKVEEEQQQQGKYNVDKNQKSTIDIIKAQKLEPKKLQQNKVKEHAQVDFFGRVVKATSVTAKTGRSNEQNTARNSLLNKNIRFRFNEGYTNAVRRKVKVKDFL